MKRRKKSDGASDRGPATEDTLKRTESAAALKAAQQYFQKLVPPGVSLADEIIQEHRDEVKREASEEWGRSRLNERGAARTGTLHFHADADWASIQADRPPGYRRSLRVF